MYSNREQPSDPTPQTSPSSLHHPVDAVATSELPPAVKTGSIVALIVVIFGTLVGSLAVSPDPNAIVAEEVEETVATDEAAMEEIEEVEEMAATPATSVTEDEPATAAAGTETETTPLAADGTATPASPSPLAEGTAPAAAPTETVEEPATADTSPSEMATSEPAATPAPGMAETPAATAPEPTTDTAASPVPTGVTETPETPGMAPTDGTAGEEMAAAPDAVDVDQLNQVVYDKLDRAWTVQGTPVTAQVSYLVTVTPEGAIAKFEPQSPDASENADNTPLPGLVKSDGMTEETSGQTVTFEVMFSDTGALEVKPSR
jgi:hypothetical protein